MALLFRIDSELLAIFPRGCLFGGAEAPVEVGEIVVAAVEGDFGNRNICLDEKAAGILQCEAHAGIPLEFSRC